MYKFETHLHTNACSACAVSSGKEMVDAAKENGFSGFVITNHFYHGNTCVDRNLDWYDFIDAYRKDYEITREYGESKGIKVFFGIEEGFAPGKEMLIYGVTPEQLIEHPEFIMLGAKEKSDLIHKLGGITICAHPYRNRAYIPDPDTDPDITLFDAIEGYNRGNPDNENEKAVVFAKQNKMIITSGGDIHSATAFGPSGIAFDTEITDYDDFINRVKNGNFKLITKNGLI